MEAFGILIYAICGLIAAPLLCFVVARYSPRFPWAASQARILSFALLAIFAVELISVYFAGPVRLRAFMGPIYFPLHAVATLFAAPALACALLLSHKTISRWWPAVAVLAWCLGVFAIFYQYQVAEALYGVDGSGGPYS